MPEEGAIFPRIFYRADWHRPLRPGTKRHRPGVSHRGPHVILARVGACCMVCVAGMVMFGR